VGSIPISSTEALDFSSPQDGVGTVGAESLRILEVGMLMPLQVFQSTQQKKIVQSFSHWTMPFCDGFPLPSRGTPFRLPMSHCSP
jgi:hypothetical protein